MATIKNQDPEKSSRSVTEPVLESAAVQYPPQDGGIKAWLFLAGASIVEITAWGKPEAECV